MHIRGSRVQSKGRMGLEKHLVLPAARDLFDKCSICSRVIRKESCVFPDALQAHRYHQWHKDFPCSCLFLQKRGASQCEGSALCANLPCSCVSAPGVVSATFCAMANAISSPDERQQHKDSVIPQRSRLSICCRFPLALGGIGGATNAACCKPIPPPHLPFTLVIKHAPCHLIPKPPHWGSSLVGIRGQPQGQGHSRIDTTSREHHQTCIRERARQEDGRPHESRIAMQPLSASNGTRSLKELRSSSPSGTVQSSQERRCGDVTLLHFTPESLQGSPARGSGRGSRNSGRTIARAKVLYYTSLEDGPSTPRFPLVLPAGRWKHRGTADEILDRGGGGGGWESRAPHLFRMRIRSITVRLLQVEMNVKRTCDGGLLLQPKAKRNF
ncbi:hypothetical protein QBC44DRAFT_303230 [Cladorrhinum sp. PSN332]|nr:hypothetical protein QBC44DRAFT_303230 [Cladorrhinum sp. PSN332]